jgi:hypothetical protein
LDSRFTLGSQNEEADLLYRELQFAADEEWLRELYNTRLCLQDPQQNLQKRFQRLDEVSRSVACVPIMM